MNTLPAGSPGTVRIFSAPALVLEATIEPGVHVNKVVWSADSRLLAVSLGDETVAVYDRHGAQPVKKIPMPQPGSWNISLVGGETFVIEHQSGLNAYLVPFDLWSRSLEFNGVGPGDIDTDPASDSFVVGALDNTLTRWQVVHPAGWRVMAAPRQGGYKFGTDGALDFSPDGRWIATGHVRYTVVRASETGRLGAEIDSKAADNLDFGSVAFTDDGRAVVRVSPVTGVQRYALADDGDGGLNAGPAETLDAEAGYSLAAVSPDRRQLLLANLDTGAVKVDRLTGKGATVQARWKAPGAYSAAFSPDGRLAVINPSGAGADRAIQRLRVYRTSDGSVVRDLGQEVSCDVSWSRDGRSVMTSNGLGKGIVWDASTWSPRLRLSGPMAGNATTFALSADGSYAVVQAGRDVLFVSMTGRGHPGDDPGAGSRRIFQRREILAGRAARRHSLGRWAGGYDRTGCDPAGIGQDRSGLVTLRRGRFRPWFAGFLQFPGRQIGNGDYEPIEPTAVAIPALHRSKGPVPAQIACPFHARCGFNLHRATSIGPACGVDLERARVGRGLHRACDRPHAQRKLRGFRGTGLLRQPNQHHRGSRQCDSRRGGRPAHHPRKLRRRHPGRASRGPCYYGIDENGEPRTS